MSTALTQYGVDDLQTILEAFSNLGTDILSGEVTEDVKAINKKALRKFKMKEACKMALLSFCRNHSGITFISLQI